MLVLTRKTGQMIRIGNTVEVAVLEIRGDRVRIGLNAPRDVSIRRQEVLERIAREEQTANRPVGPITSDIDRRRKSCIQPSSKQIAKTCASAS
jgi:carbon storage regulator